MPEFAGPAVPLTDADIAAAAQQLRIPVAAIRAVDHVESRGHGFLPDGRPTILFERHIFSRLSGHRFDGSHPAISNQMAGGYGAAGAHQYDRLAEAITLDRTAALNSASWGRFQIMGFNAGVCGWRDVETFVASMMESEAQHLTAFIGFCRTNHLLQFLATHDWASFAKGYNGAGNVAEYAAKLAAAYRDAVDAPPLIATTDPAGTPVGTSHRAIGPRDTIKRIQEALGVVNDGIFGPRSRAAFDALLRQDGQHGL